VSYNKVGDVQLEQRDLAGALKSFSDGLAIADRLAKADPDNAAGQHDLMVSLSRVGNAQLDQGDLAGALKSYSDGLAIADRLAKADPDNAVWQRNLSVSLNRVGDVQLDQGDLAGALKSHSDGLAIADRLAKADPGNAVWQRDLAVSNELLAEVYKRLARTAEAVAAFECALRVYRALSARNHDDTESLLLSVLPLWKLGELRGKQGQGDLESALAILKPLADAGRLNATRQGWIHRIQKQIAELNA
jgi:tetratricopeptide (TPR) repeat protein